MWTPFRKWVHLVTIVLYLMSWSKGHRISELPSEQPSFGVDTALKRFSSETSSSDYKVSENPPVAAT